MSRVQFIGAEKAEQELRSGFSLATVAARNGVSFCTQSVAVTAAD